MSTSGSVPGMTAVDGVQQGFAGTLTELPLADLLRTLARDAHTGVLQVGGSYASQVCVTAGEVYLATSASGPSLRQEVVGAGLVTAAGWDASEQVARVEGRGLADALMRTGGADPASLRHLVYEHTVTTAFELMIPSADPFRFVPGEAHPFGDAFRFKAEQVLRDAGRRLEAWRAIAEAFPTTDIVLRVAPTLPLEADSVTVSATEWQVLARLDGESTISEMIRAVGMSAFTVCSALHRLLTAGAIEIVPPPR